MSLACFVARVPFETLLVFLDFLLQMCEVRTKLKRKPVGNMKLIRDVSQAEVAGMSWQRLPDVSSLQTELASEASCLDGVAARCGVSVISLTDSLHNADTRHQTHKAPGSSELDRP